MSDSMKPLISLISEGFQIQLTIFEDFVHPAGVLDYSMEAHGLMYYYLHAYYSYAKFEIGNPIIYEGEDDPRLNYEQLFLSVASLYGVNPTYMANRWAMIDEQCRLMGFPLMPQGFKYRSASVIQLLH